MKESKRGLRVVADNSNRRSRSPQASDEMSARSLFQTITIFTIILVILGLGPVIVTADATRASQQSTVIKRDIDQAMIDLEELELKRSMLRSSVRIAEIAQEELGMIPMSGDFQRIEIGTSTDIAQAQIQNEVDSGLRAAADLSKEENIFASFATRISDEFEADFTKDMIAQISELTLGEASTLLVGDISIASWR